MSDIRPGSIELAAGQIGQPAGGIMNPLDAMGKLANIQNAMNQNRLFQMQMAGRQRFGEIVSSGVGSLEDRYMAAMQDPVASAFAPQMLNELRQANLALIKAHGEVQSQATSGFQTIGQAYAAVASDPNMTREQYKDLVKSKMALLSPEAQRASAFGAGSAESYIWDGTADGPAGYQARALKASALAAANGMDPANIRGWTGQVAPAVTWQQDPSGAISPAYVGAPLGGPTGVRWLDQPAPAPGAPAPGAPAPEAAPGTRVAAAGGAVSDAAAGEGLLPEELKTAPAKPTGPMPVRGPTLQQQKETEAQAKVDEDTKTGMAEVTKGMLPIANRVNALMDAQKFFRAGGFTKGGIEAGRLITGFGRAFDWDEETIKRLSDMAAGGSLADAQLFNSLINNEAINALKLVATGTGRVMRPEVDTAMAGLNINMDPEMLWRYLNTQVRPVIQRAYDMGEKFPKYRLAVDEGRMPNRRISDFESYEDQYFNPRTAIQTTKGGINVGPRDISEIRPQPAPAGPTPPVGGGVRGPAAVTPAPAPPGGRGYEFGVPPSMR